MLIKDLLKKNGMFNLNTIAESVVISTVDRFQGDENDIIIASLVTDEKSKTGFVKLVNRMIVLLSRSRIGLYIVGNAGYFGNSGVEHWKKTIELLEQPAPNDVVGNDESALVAFSGKRIGNALPICCPLHRKESKKLVKDHSDLYLGFCKEKCAAILPCGHACNEDCHWPTDTHNLSCKSEIESPCPFHNQSHLCKDINPNKYLVNDVILRYRCTVKVDIQLPCGHNATISCADEQDIARNISKLPVCNEQAHEPFIYDQCYHSLVGTCSIIGSYKQNPLSAPPCMFKIDYLYACGHISPVKCYMAKMYESRTQTPVCTEKVTINLPRCFHSCTMSCAEAQTVSKWTGLGIEKFNPVVKEGEQYGPVDFNCKKDIILMKKCGHQAKLNCSIAFQLAQTGEACKEMDNIQSPICGHNVQVTCSTKERIGLTAVQLPIDVFEEGVTVIGICVEFIKCTKKVTFIKRCGHQEDMECSQAIRLLSSVPKTVCMKPVFAKSALCGHEGTFPCSVRKTWKPWSSEFLSSTLYENMLIKNVITDAFDTPIPNAAIGNSGCDVMVKFKRSKCEHEENVKCRDAFERLKSRNMPECTEMVKFKLSCNHFGEIQCNMVDKCKTKGKCKSDVLRQCWNYSVCGQKVTMKCKDGHFVCQTTSTWTCSTGKHSYKLKQCSQGIPSVCPGCDLEKIDFAIEACENQEFILQDLDLPFAHLTKLDIEGGQFLQRKVHVLSALKKIFSEPTLLLTPKPLFEPKIIPCFVVCNGQKKHLTSFDPKVLVSGKTYNGMEVFEYQKNTLIEVRDKYLKDGSVAMLFGIAFICIAHQIGSISQNAKAKKSIDDQKRENIVDAIHVKSSGSLILFSPFAVLATHKAAVSLPELNRMINAAEMSRITPKAITTFTKPDLKAVPFVDDKGNDDSEVVTFNSDSFAKCPDLDVFIPKTWDGETLYEGNSVVQKELINKLMFVSSKQISSPYSGKSCSLM
jgi:hypothetical protein